MPSWFPLSIEEEDDPRLSPVDDAFEECDFHVHALNDALQQIGGEAWGKTVGNQLLETTEEFCFRSGMPIPHVRSVCPKHGHGY